MTTIDHCLAELTALVQSRDEHAEALARASIDHLLSEASADTGAAVRLLGELQDRLARATTASPQRSDILDAIGAHVVRLLESEEARDP